MTVIKSNGSVCLDFSNKNSGTVAKEYFANTVFNSDNEYLNRQKELGVTGQQQCNKCDDCYYRGMGLLKYPCKCCNSYSKYIPTV